MQARLATVHWNLVVRTAVVVYVVIFVLGVVLSFLWVALLGDIPARVQAAQPVFSLITALLVVAVTGYGAWRVARRVDREAVLHGVLVGLIAALLSFLLDFLFSGQIQLVGLLLYALIVAAGWVGGVLGARRDP